MKELIDKYNLGDPAAGKGYGEFSNSELQQLYHDLVARGSSSEVDALSTAAMIEEFDIVELRKNVANTNREDVLAAYSKLMAGSQNHLEIFTAKLKEKAVVYQPQYLSQQDYNQIIAAVANGNTTTTTTATINSTSTAPTFGELAVNGKQSYSSICINCHGESLSTGSASSVTLSKYQNAQKLLEKISGMPMSGKQKQWEVLSYLLLEHNWVSGTTIFNPDTLSQIALSQ
jgi:mono/diheme cytochrome c family protein